MNLIYYLWVYINKGGFIMFHHICHTPIANIPTSYLEALTYLEQILCINKKLSDIISYLNNYSFENIEKLMDDKLQHFSDDIDIKLNDLKDFSSSLINSEISNVLSIINEKVIFLIDFINNSNDNLLSKFQQEILDIKYKIDDIISNGINVFDPTVGSFNSINSVLNNIYNDLRYHAISCLNFDSLGLSAISFDSKYISAKEFDLYSNRILFYDFTHTMFSLFSGKLQPITSIISSLIDLHRNSITAKSFDDINLSSKSFDDKNISAFQFDWNNTLI